MDKKEVLLDMLDTRFDGDIMPIKYDEIEELLALIVKLLPNMDSDKIEPVGCFIKFITRRSFSVGNVTAIRKKTLEDAILLMEK